VPLIRVKYNDGKHIPNSYFIDHCGRVYETWNDFLNENIFDGWWICVPTGGVYAFNDYENVQVEFYDQTSRGEVLKTLDRVSTISSAVTSVSMTAGLVMSFIPVTAPFGWALTLSSTIVGAPGAAYGAGRSVGKLVDRGNHDQSISLLDSEARACWITTVASVLSVGTLASAKILATTSKAGLLASAGTRAFCTGLSVTALSVSGIGIINSIVEISKKDKVTGLDVLQLTTSVFFFTHSAINFKTASTMIKEAQNSKLASIKQTLSPEEQKVFDSMLKGKQEMVTPGKVRTMHGSKEFIRELKHIGNKHEFFSHFTAGPGTQLNVNDALVIDAKAFLQMTNEQRELIMKHSKDLKENRITQDVFDRKVGAISREYRIAFEHQRNEAKNKIQDAFQVSISLTFYEQFFV